LKVKVSSLDQQNTRLFVEAVPGDNIGFNVNIISVRELRRGFVCSDAQNEPAQQTASFIAQVSRWKD
jgi:elongation factor 1-alpha